MIQKSNVSDTFLQIPNQQDMAHSNFYPHPYYQNLHDNQAPPDQTDINMIQHPDNSANSEEILMSQETNHVDSSNNFQNSSQQVFENQNMTAQIFFFQPLHLSTVYSDQK